MTRDQMINHLILHGWFPVLNSQQKEHAVGLLNNDGRSVWLRFQDGLVTAYRGSAIAARSIQPVKQALETGWDRLADVELAALLGVIERET